MSETPLESEDQHESSTQPKKDRKTQVTVNGLIKSVEADIIHNMTDDSLQKWRGKVDADLRGTILKKKEHSVHSKLPALTEYPFNVLMSELSAMGLQGSSGEEQLFFSPPPTNVPAAIGADLACNIAGYAKKNGASLQETASRIADKLRAHPLVESVSLAGPFVNVCLRKAEFAGKTFESIRGLGNHYGHFNEGNGAVAFFDFSHPNIAKNMTVGHLRSTLIGDVLCNIHEAGGYVPIRGNYLGDWGTQFGKLIYEYRKELERDPEGLQKRLYEDPISTLMELYRAFVKREEEDETALVEARENFLKLEHGDVEITALWEKFRAWSLEAFEKVYKRLGIDFDTFQGESAFAKLALEVIQDGLDKGIFKKDGDGSAVFPQQLVLLPGGKEVEMEKDEIVLKPSGATVYLTRDLAAIRYRAQELGAKKLVYVIGKEQEKHCAMLFRMAEQLGYIQLGQAQHFPFGHMTVGGKKMGSRKGQVMLMTDILDEAIENAASLLRKHNAESEREASTDDDAIAQKVAIGSLFFNDLKQNRERNIEFDPEKSVAIEAGQGPYIQYSYARINGILRGLEIPDESRRIPQELNLEESMLTLHLSQFPEAVAEALQNGVPHKIATYLDQLCKLTNTFYQNHHVQKSEGDQRVFRIRLMLACKQVLENAAKLIHLPLPEHM
ncbi:MAG: arginine--tRNA ligase [Candidatus Peribacteraceae bacterium]|nr:arginine--tRNA ligase [Candidatus Peribacteraceae bacterium]